MARAATAVLCALAAWTAGAASTVTVPVYEYDATASGWYKNTGLLTPSSVQVRIGASTDSDASKWPEILSLLQTVTKTGYTLSTAPITPPGYSVSVSDGGWFGVMSSSSGWQILPNQSSSAYSSGALHHFVAVFTPKTSELAFDANGGSGTMTEGGVATYDADMPTPIALPARTGYTFVGFYDYNTGGTQYYTASGASARTWNKDTTSPTTLYAHWTVNQYTATFKLGNGEADVMKTQDYGSTLTAPSPTRTGYIFSGWTPAVPDSMPAESKTFTAQWAAKTTVLTLNANGGATTTSGANLLTRTFDQTSYWAHASMSSNATTYVGHTFDGWWATAGGGEQVYDADGKAVPGSCWTLVDPSTGQCKWKCEDSYLTLYAHWTVNQYTATFKLGNGEADVLKTQEYGSSLAAPSPTRTGYVFSSWDSTVPATMPAESRTFNAQWAAKTSALTFNANGGTGAMSTGLFATFGQPMPTPIALPSRTGYTFVGFYSTSAQSGGLQYYSSSGASTRSWYEDTTSSTTLYARWTVNQYTATFKLGNGEADVVKTQDYGSTLTAPSPTRTGYTFSSWTPAVPAAMPAASTTFTAQWSAKTTTLTLDANGGRMTATPPTLTYDATSYWSSGAMSSNRTTRTGYDFDGWWSAVSGGEQVYDAAGNAVSGSHWTLVNPSTGQCKWQYDGTRLTLYARWNPKTYVLTVNPNYAGATGYTSPDANHPVAPTFGTTNYRSIGTATRAGYRFDGWYSAADGGVLVYDVDGLAVKGEYWSDSYANRGVWQYDGDLTVYAHWTETAVVMLDNGSAGNPTQSTVLCTNECAMPPVTPPTRVCYDFWGYYTMSNGRGTRYYSENGRSVKTYYIEDGVTNLYAYWERRAYSFHYRGNTPHGEAISKERTVSFDADDVFLNAEDFGYSAKGYVFDYWTVAADGSGDSYAPGISVDNFLYAHDDSSGHEYTFYAQWTPIQYSIAFEANGGDGVLEAISLSYDSPTNLPSSAELSRTGYVFDGWTNSSGTVFADGAAVSNLTATAGTTITLFAKWTPISYEIVFDANGGVGAMESIPMTYDNPATNLPPCMFSREGYGFAGWATNAPPVAIADVVYADCALVSNLVVVTNASANMHAVWTGVTYQVVFDACDGYFGSNQSSHITNVWVTVGDVFGSLPAPTPGDPNYTGYKWQFTTNGVTVDVKSETEVPFGLTTITAKWFRYDLLAEALDLDPETYVVNTSSGVGTWTVVERDDAVGGKCMKGTCVSSETSNRNAFMRIIVEGPGTLTFKWKVSCRDWGGTDGNVFLAGLRFYHKLTESQYDDPTYLVWECGISTNEWNTYSFPIEDGKRELVWEYYLAAGKVNEVAENSAWIDNVTWTPSSGEPEAPTGAGGASPMSFGRDASTGALTLNVNVENALSGWWYGIWSTTNLLEEFTYYTNAVKATGTSVSLEPLTLRTDSEPQRFFQIRATSIQPSSE